MNQKNLELLNSFYQDIQEALEKKLAAALLEIENGVTDAIQKLAEREKISQKMAFNRYRNTATGGPRIIELATLKRLLAQHESGQAELLDFLNDLDKK